MGEAPQGMPTLQPQAAFPVPREPHPPPAGAAASVWPPEWGAAGGEVLKPYRTAGRRCPAARVTERSLRGGPRPLGGKQAVAAAMPRLWPDSQCPLWGQSCPQPRADHVVTPEQDHPVAQAGTSAEGGDGQPPGTYGAGAGGGSEGSVSGFWGQLQRCRRAGGGCPVVLGVGRVLGGEVVLGAEGEGSPRDGNHQAVSISGDDGGLAGREWRVEPRGEAEGPLETGTAPRSSQAGSSRPAAPSSPGPLNARVAETQGCCTRRPLGSQGSSGGQGMGSGWESGVRGQGRRRGLWHQHPEEP